MYKYFIKNNIKIYIIIINMLLISVVVYANERVSSKNSVNISFSMIPLENKEYSFERVMPGLELEYSRFINHFLGLGAYAGYGMYMMYYVEKGDNWVTSVSRGETYSYSYGVSCNLHLFPLILQKRLKRLDVYATSKLGNIFFNSHEQTGIMPEYGNYLDLSLMLGSSLFLSNKFGVNIQYGYRYFEYNKGFNAKYGLLFRF